MQSRFYEWLKAEGTLSKPLLLLCENDKEARELADVGLYLGIHTFVLPDFRASYGEDLRSWSDELGEIVFTLQQFWAQKSPKKLLVSPFRTVTHRLPAESLQTSLKLEFAQKIELQQLKERLAAWGYDFVEIVEKSGELSFRGDIFDIFDLHAQKPVRICLFDNEIESIRYFDEQTQRTQKEELEYIEIHPALFALSGEEYDTLSSQCSTSHFDAIFKDPASLGLWYLQNKIFYTDICKTVFIDDYKEQIEELYETSGAHRLDKSVVEALPVIPHPKQTQELICADIHAVIAANAHKKITIIARSQTLLKQFELENLQGIRTLESDAILNLSTPDEIILSLAKREKKSKTKKSPTALLDELKVGDYIVHEKYGVGIFEGLKPVRVLGATKEFVQINYQNDDKLLVPVENLGFIDRYIGNSGSVPVLDRLGKGSFAKLKESVREKLFEIAGEIVKLAADRELSHGTAIAVNDPRLSVFASSAGFEYTVDQKKAVEEIFADLSSGRVMDRLLSGDVGFGKTEVAMNAIYAVALNKKSCVVIVPTTLLSSQHAHSFEQRFKEFGLRVGRLDRFVTAAEKKRLLAQIEAGAVDVLIGTHALLEVKMPNLALVIIDEEHKFGVKQKEKLKALSQGVHLLSMSATPIPRSLNLALSRVKSLSTITTPPKEREGVRTFVREYDEKLLKEAILRELRRGGQLFYIHNRIGSIESVKKELLSLMPQLKICVLHSKIDAATTEAQLIAFENGEYQMLLSTSIIESGINMPHVNTIIVDGADKFGMADLHQLRGRVGRGSRQGYCYFMVEEKSALTEDAKRRLVALESNSYLGSGAALAYHDLEIRGGGNILGEAQSGHIKGVGYSLYLKMLEDAICELSGQAHKSEREVEIKLAVSAYISSDYIAEDRLRLELYRRLALCAQRNDIFDIAVEMEDRFGKPDLFTQQFLQLIEIKLLAANAEVVNLSSFEQNITVLYANGKKEYLKAPSRDDDDILAECLKFLRSKQST